MTQKQGVYRFYGHRGSFSSKRSGFTLVEILVVISIIAILVAIGAAAAIKAQASARADQTRQMMEALLAANDEYKAVRQSAAITIDPSSALSSSEQYVQACLTIKTCEDIMMAALNSSTNSELNRILRDSDNNNFNGIYDRWGNELEYRLSNNPDATGPAEPANENGDTVDNDVLPRSRDPFFASAGPDGEWGTDDDISTVQQ